MVLPEVRANPELERAEAFIASDDRVVVLESPGDGAAGIAASWKPASSEVPWAVPTMVGGIRREECRNQFRRYCAAAADSGFRRWAQTLVDLPD